MHSFDGHFMNMKIIVSSIFVHDGHFSFL